MNITSYMTTIVLEKDSEDKELYKEIILIKEKFLDYHHFMEDFPMINKLRQLLYSEIHNNQNGEY